MNNNYRPKDYKFTRNSGLSQNDFKDVKFSDLSDALFYCGTLLLLILILLLLILL